MRPVCFGKRCRPERSSHSVRAKQLATMPQRTRYPLRLFYSDQVSPFLCKRRRGLHSKAHDALPFPEPMCAEEQKQAGAAHVLEGEQEGMGDI